MRTAIADPGGTRVRAQWGRAATVAVLLCACASGLPPAQARAAASPPDSVTLEALRADLSRAGAVRVTQAEAAHVLRDVRLDASGIVSSRWGPGAAARPALIVPQDAWPPPAPRPIPWSEISRIETGSRSVAHSALAGLLAGGLLGTVIWSTVPLGADGAHGPAPIVVGLPAAAGCLLGAIVWGPQYQWSTIYPRDPLPGSRQETRR